MRNNWLSRARLESLVLQHHESASGVIRVQKVVNRDYGHYFAKLSTDSEQSDDSASHLARAGGLKLGRGFHSLSGLICKSPFSVVEMESNIEDPPRRQYELRTIHSESALFECLDLDPAASFSGFGVWASDKVKWAKERRINHYCVYLLAKLKVTSRIDYLSQFEVETNAQTLLKSSYGSRQFYQDYGNTFISACQEGGELIALFEFDTNSPFHQEQLRSSLESLTGAWNDFEPFESALRSFQKDEVPRLHLFVNGADERHIQQNRERLLTLFKDFPEWVSIDEGKPSRFHVFCQDYASAIDESTLAQSPWDKNQLLYDQLAGYADRISMMVNDIEYINNHTQIFSQTEYVNKLSRLQHLYQSVLECASLITDSPDETRILPADIAMHVNEIESSRPQQTLLEKAPTVGIRLGEAFDDAHDSNIRESNAPRYFLIHETEVGLGVGAYYERKEGPDYIGKTHGAESRNPNGFYLAAKEYLVEVSGTYDNESNPAITTLEFNTNLGRVFGPFGNKTKTSRQFRFNALAERRIIGFHGFTNPGLNALGPVYGPLQFSHTVRLDAVMGGPKGDDFGSIEDLGILNGTLKRVEIKMLPMTLNLRELNKIGQLKFSIISGLQFYYAVEGPSIYSPGVFGANSVGGIDIFLEPDEYIVELSGAWLHFPTSFPLVGRALMNAMGEEYASDYLLDHISVRTNKRVLHDLGGSAMVSAALRHIMKKRTFSFVAPSGFEITGVKGRATSAITALGAIYRLRKDKK